MADPLRSDLVGRRRGLRIAVRRADAIADQGRPSPGISDFTADDTALGPDVVEFRVRLDSERGLVEARRQGRRLATRGGFSLADRAIIAAITSELGRNILLYAGRGDIVVKLIEDDRRVALVITASDTGPGIPDLSQALRDGFSTSGRLGMGLPGVKRLSDGFDITCGRDRGTTVVAQKWRR